MKRLLAIFAIAVCGCGAIPPANVQTIPAGPRLEIQILDRNFRIIRDKKTGREFILFHDSDNSCMVEIREADTRDE